MPADGFEMVDAFAPTEAGNDVRLFNKPVRRNEDRNLLADGFAASVPENSLGALVPARDKAVEVFVDDRVIGAFNDGGEESESFSAAFAFQIVGGLAGEE